jgi:rod shape-determining protein MreD
MTAVLSVVAMLGLGLLQIFLPQLWFGFGAIDWLLMYVVLQSLRVGFRASILTGAAAGLIQDGLSGGIIGLHAFAKTTVAALISTFGGLMVVRGPIPEAAVAGTAAVLEGFIVVAWQAMLGRPVSLGPIDLVVRGVATGAAAVLVLTTARWWQRRTRMGGRGGRP